jgi:hypothetical protein
MLQLHNNVLKNIQDALELLKNEESKILTQLDKTAFNRESPGAFMLEHLLKVNQFGQQAIKLALDQTSHFANQLTLQRRQQVLADKMTLKENNE